MNHGSCYGLLSTSTFNDLLNKIVRRYNLLNKKVALISVRKRVQVQKR